MNRETLEKINSKLVDVDAIEKILSLDDSFSVNVSYNYTHDMKSGNKAYVSFNARMPCIRPLIIAYNEQLKKELKDLGFEENEKS